jgi:hypothetical protein
VAATVDQVVVRPVLGRFQPQLVPVKVLRPSILPAWQRARRGGHDNKTARAVIAINRAGGWRKMKGRSRRHVCLMPHHQRSLMFGHQDDGGAPRPPCLRASIHL